MRNIAFALIAFVSMIVTSSADAQQYRIGPIGRPVQFARPMAVGQPGDSRVDPGCNIYRGGDCGLQLQQRCATWMQMRRVNHGGFPLPPECGGGGVVNGGGVGYGGRGVVNGGGQQVVTYGQPQIQTYTVQGPRHIIGYDVTCTVTHADGRTEIRPGHCPG